MVISRISALSMWFVVSIFYAYQYILRVMPNIMMNDIMQQYGIDATIFGQFSGVYFIGYALVHIPLGMMLDAYGPKKVIPVCIGMSAFGLLPIIFTNVWLYPIIGRVLIGMGSSGAILGVFKVIRFAFREDQFTRMLSFSVIIGLIGAIYGSGPVNYMCTFMDYRVVVSIFAAAGIGLAFITYFIIPAIPTQQTSFPFAKLKEIVLSYKAMLVCIFAGLLVGPLEGFSDAWATTFLVKVYGLSKAFAAQLPSAIFLGMAFGGPLLSIIAEKTKNYVGVIFGTGIVMTAIFTALVTGIMPTNSGCMIGAFIVIGICCAYQIIAIYKASTYVKPHVAELTAVIANMVIMIFGYFFHAIIGRVVDATGGVENATALTYGVSVLPIALLIGSFGFFAIAMHDHFSRKS